jgi:hypothetical protein
VHRALPIRMLISTLRKLDRLKGWFLRSHQIAPLRLLRTSFYPASSFRSKRISPADDLHRRAGFRADLTEISIGLSFLTLRAETRLGAGGN